MNRLVLAVEPVQVSVQEPAAQVLADNKKITFLSRQTAPWYMRNFKNGSMPDATILSAVSALTATETCRTGDYMQRDMQLCEMQKQ